jgi:hypothetical protein
MHEVATIVSAVATHVAHILALVTPATQGIPPLD